MDLRPLAPVFFAIAFLAISRIASSLNSKSTSSNSNNLWYCLIKEFFGSFKILTKEISSKSSKVAIIGILPMNSGISPYLIKYGLIPEFIGRMPIIATLKELDEKSLVKILKEPKNSLLRQYKRLFEFEDVKLEFRDDALIEISKKAISKKTGARGLRSILESLLLKTMFSLPDMENVESVTVDKSVVKGKSEPIITYSKAKSTSVA